jgi:hypothetical protein
MGVDVNPAAANTWLYVLGGRIYRSQGATLNDAWRLVIAAKAPTSEPSRQLHYLQFVSANVDAYFTLD